MELHDLTNLTNCIGYFGEPPNFWVNVVFSNALDTTPPTMTATSPAAGAMGVAPGSNLTATFSESVVSGTISFVLKADNGTFLGSTFTYNDSTHTAILTPVFPMAYSASYTATISGSQDLSGSTMSSVSWSFTSLNAWSQTSVADFAAGTQSGTMVTDMSGGEVSLASSFADEFDGTALGSAWTTTSWAPSGGGPTSVTEASGILSVAGAEVLSANAAIGAGVEGSVNFGATPYQSFGMATDLSTVLGNTWALFGTQGTSNTLFAQVNLSGTTQSVNLGALPSGFHDYRIVPVAGGIRFSVDGVALTTINLTISAGVPLAIAMSTFNGSPQPAMQVDWVRTTSYATSGTFTSSTYDAGRNVVWGAVNWTANLPAGTSISVLTSSSTDGVIWSAWTAATNGGTVSSPSGRYLRYRIDLTTTDPTVTPSLSSIMFTWN